MQEMCFQKGHNWNDLNAAINIKQTGIKIPEETVEEKDISPPMKQ